MIIDDCGVEYLKRGYALGFRHVAEGNDAKILDVSKYLSIVKKIIYNNYCYFFLPNTSTLGW